jgi:hypothetical protein
MRLFPGFPLPVLTMNKGEVRDAQEKTWDHSSATGDSNTGTVSGHKEERNAGNHELNPREIFLNLYG